MTKWSSKKCVRGNYQPRVAGFTHGFIQHLPVSCHRAGIGIPVLVSFGSIRDLKEGMDGMG